MQHPYKRVGPGVEGLGVRGVHYPHRDHSRRHSAASPLSKKTLASVVDNG